MKRTPRAADDSGMAMVLVMGSMVTLMVLVLAGLAYVMQSERFARHDQDYSSAMSAAQAGIDDYISSSTGTTRTTRRWTARTWR